MRKPVIAGNWKLNGTIAEAQALVAELKALLPTNEKVDVVVCPPFTALATVAAATTSSAIQLGAQDIFFRQKGAYTGQISGPMLLDCGCKYAIMGHSERRGRFGGPEPDFTDDVLKVFGDNDTTVNLKLRAALANGLIPICCVGEVLSEREAGQTDDVVCKQVTGALKDVSPEETATVIFAYEPVWAIGTGKVCAADEADRVCGIIRATVASIAGDAAAQAVRIQYGGSVKPDNAQDLLGRPNIDGALVGGASLKAADFAGIVTAAG
jgi:triosephosphate isomerase